MLAFHKQPLSETQILWMGLMQRRGPQELETEYHSHAGSLLHSERAPYAYEHFSVQKKPSEDSLH